MTYNTWPHRPIFDPEAIAPHHVRHHNVCRQSVAYYGDLIWPCDTGIRMRFEVCHDFLFTTRLLGRVLQDFDTGVGF